MGSIADREAAVLGLGWHNPSWGVGYSGILEVVTSNLSPITHFMRFKSVVFLGITPLAEVVWTLGAVLVVIRLVPRIEIQDRAAVLVVTGGLWLLQQAISLVCLGVGVKFGRAVVINAAIASANRPTHRLPKSLLAYRVGVAGVRLGAYWGGLSLSALWLPTVNLSSWLSGLVSAIAVLVLTPTLADIFGKPLTSLFHSRWLTPGYLLLNLGLWLAIPTSLWWAGTFPPNGFHLPSWEQSVVLMIGVSGLNYGISQVIQTTTHLLPAFVGLRQRFAAYPSTQKWLPTIIAIALFCIPLFALGIYFYLVALLIPGIAVQGIWGYVEMTLIWLLASMPQSALSDYLDRRLKQCFIP